MAVPGENGGTEGAGDKLSAVPYCLTISAASPPLRPPPMRHLRLAIRTLAKTPFVTAVAVLSLALGIGANAAIYSLFDQMLLQSLPVPKPAQLINLASPGPKPGSQSCGQAGECDEVFSYPMFRDLERSQTVLTGLAAHVGFGANLAFRNTPMSGEGMFVSGSYFPTLALTPTLGRLLTPADDDAIGAHFVTVLSHSAWESRFGSDPSVVGQIITVNGQSLTIVGVGPREFEGTTLGSRPVVFVPVSMRGVLQGRSARFEDRRNYYLYLFGRLKAGVSLAQANTALNALYRPIVTDVEAPLQTGMSAQTMTRFKAKELGIVAGPAGQSSIHREAKAPLFLLFGITAVVLLIACANIANLLLARGAGRAMEMGVRLALGASRRQLIGQVLTESVLLAVVGGVASLFVARWTLALIAGMLPSQAMSSLRFELQPSVLLFAGALSIATGLLFGMFPALHNTRGDLVSSIRANAGQISGARAAARFRSTLVTVQIALSMALLISAGLFLKSLINVSKVELGVKIDDLVTFGISPARSGYDTIRTRQFYDRLETELAAVAGVTGVTTGMVGLLSGDNWGTDVRVQGFAYTPDVDANANYNEIGAGYFATLGVKLVAGREFTTADREGTAPVAIVNQAFMKKFNLSSDAIGKFMSTNGRDSLTIQIVGVVPNAKYSDVKRAVPAVFYTPWRQDTRVGSINFYVRSSLPPEHVVRTIPGVVRQLDPMLPVEDLKTMPQQVRENVFLDRMISTLSALFAGLATLLAGIGLYGVLAYTVAQRTREIGVRMALGANAGRVRAMVMRQVGGMMLVGGVIGIAAAVGLGKAAQSLLFELKGHDPMVFALAIVVLMLVALGAGFVPAQRAANVDPMQALRYE